MKQQEVIIVQTVVLSILYFARYYDPATSRMLSQDSFRGEQTDPSSWNLYAYCAGNPINFTDPTGHKKKPIKWNKNYKPVRDSSYINCYSYVLGFDDWRNVPNYKDYDPVKTIYKRVIKDIKKNFTNKVKKLGTSRKGMNYKKYFLIAMRVGHIKFVHGSKTWKKYDYHFWVRHQNGGWSHKPGENNSIYLGSVNPTKARWDKPNDSDGYGTVTEWDKGIYNSGTWYLGIQKKGKAK